MDSDSSDGESDEEEALRTDSPFGWYWDDAVKELAVDDSDTSAGEEDSDETDDDAVAPALANRRQRLPEEERTSLLQMLRDLKLNPVEGAAREQLLQQLHEFLTETFQRVDGLGRDAAGGWTRQKLRLGRHEFPDRFKQMGLTSNEEMDSFLDEAGHADARGQKWVSKQELIKYFVAQF